MIKIYFKHSLLCSNRLRIVLYVFLDRKKDSFEIQKKENSIQKKRQYRTNKDDSSASESDKDKSSDRRVFLYLYTYFFFSFKYLYTNSIN